MTWEEIKAEYRTKGFVTIRGKEVVDNGRFNSMTYVPFPESFEGKRVLDVGTGPGVWAYTAEDRGAKEVIAIDSSDAMLQIAESNRPPDSKVNFIQMDAMDLRLGPQFNEPFDVILCLAMIHYLEKPEELLMRLSSMLKPGGTLILETYAKTGTEDGPEIYKWQPSPQDVSIAVRRHFNEITTLKLHIPDKTSSYRRIALAVKKARGTFFFITGVSGSGKTTIATEIKQRNPEFHVIMPDMDLIEDHGATLKTVTSPYGLDMNKYIKDSIRRAVEAGVTTIVLEAVMPSITGRRGIFESLPPDWERYTILVDLTEQEEVHYLPEEYLKNAENFHKNEPLKRQWNIDGGPIINVGPLDFWRAIRLVELIAG